MLRESARQEFEAARFEDDPEIVRRVDVWWKLCQPAFRRSCKWTQSGQACRSRLRLESSGGTHGSGSGRRMKQVENRRLPAARFGAACHPAERPCLPAAALQVNRLLVVGRDSVHQVAERFL